MEQLLKAGEVEREAVPEVDSLMCFYLNKPLPFLFYPLYMIIFVWHDIR